MMTNLFSTFDPATSMKMSLNWMSTLLMLFMMPLPLWVTHNRLTMMTQLVNKKLHEEFTTLMKSKSKGISLMMVSLLTFIFINNFMGLMPYVFTSSSHLVFSMTMALPLWMSIMLFGWINNTNHMFSHLVPLGTPSVLMPFMVLIETISNIIRPGSLAVRLTANMIAGHLLMSLLGNSTMTSDKLVIPLIFTVQLMLMLFEMSVSIIQAYVFSILSTLYTSEVI
uniref:ATP synthase F0 subunit 6 n=1 Tax=Brachyplatys subaeneus TaxID=355284 RepID=UPI001D102733|nr:ATP synthase F0 subunit 6 [Brachyplatys subaeneus]UCC45913.1 ATP synthase F0 subunit 6 [Brachyplatys subaeneus]